MSTAQNVAKIIPGVMSLGLVGESLKMIPSAKDIKKGKAMKPAEFLKGTTKILIGVPLIGVVAGQINALP